MKNAINQLSIPSTVTIDVDDLSRLIRYANLMALNVRREHPNQFTGWIRLKKKLTMRIYEC